MTVSAEFPRIAELAEAQRPIEEFLTNSTYARRQNEPGIADFTLGNPHEMPLDAYVDAMKKWAEPDHERWYGYQFSLEEAQEAAAEGLARWTGVPFESKHLTMTNGGFGASSAAIKAVGTAEDEAIFGVPPWFAYDMIIREAGLRPVRVSLVDETFDLDIEAIRASITPKTRIVIVNSPHNPTGRIYPPDQLASLAEMLDEESLRIGRRIYVLSDEPYNRIVFDGRRFHTPAEFYPHTLVAYSYGKVHLTPGQRIGYLALSPFMPNHEQIKKNITVIQGSSGYAFPSTLLQRAVVDLERVSIDIDHLQRKRDRFLNALWDMGYEVHVPEGTFYLLPRSPIEDDVEFTEMLAEHDVFVMPGTVCEIPGYFRVSLTASDEMIDRSLDGFRTAIERAMLGSSPAPEMVADLTTT